MLLKSSEHLQHPRVRANVDYPDYPYARFDIHLDPVTYTEEEYRQYLQNPTWTKSETDRLMDLARRYELRWAVIYDGWLDACQAPGRKIEDLQHRYYSVAALLTQSRVVKEASAEVASLSSSAPPTSADPEQAKTAAENLVMETAAARAIATAEPSHQPLIATIGSGTTNKNIFDLNKERRRRAHLELIWRRTKEEELEEAELRKELRLVEAQIRKLKKSGGHILAAASSAVGGSSASRNPSRSVTPVPMAAAAGRAAAATVMSDSDLLDQCFASTAPTPMPQTPYLQSGRLVAPATGGPVGLNKTTLKRMDDVLDELKIPKRPMPTKRVCDLYDSVRKDALTLLTLQKMVLQKEGQLQSRRLKLAKLGGSVRVVDEETLLGIIQPASATSASTSGGTGRSKSGGSKPKASRSSGGRSKTKSDSGAGDSKGGGKKGGTKRKKKSEGKSASAAVAAAATAAAGQAPPAKTKSDNDEGKPAKKRVRKS